MPSYVCFFKLLYTVYLLIYNLYLSIGFVTDGEFNSLRTQGSKRPVSVIQLIMDAKNEARAIPSKEIEKFFTPVNKGTVLYTNIIPYLQIDFI